MKLSSYTRYSETDIYQKAINENWIGNGTSKSPFIIESTHSLSDQSLIKNTSLHFLINNCTFKSLTLNRCKNLKFEGCTFEVLGLNKCSGITLDNCSFKTTLELRFSHNLHIQGSHIPFLIFSMSYENHFKTCTINKIYNHFSRANIFEVIDTPEDLNTIMRIGPKMYYIKYLGFIAAAVLSLILGIIIYFSSYSDLIIWSLVGGLFLMAFITFVVATALYLDYKKMQHHPDNQIF